MGRPKIRTAAEVKEIQRNWRLRNKERQSQYNKEYVLAHREELASKRKIYRERMKEPIRLRNHELRRKLRVAVVSLLGGKCVRCGFFDFRALQVDHINGGGSKELKEGNNSSRQYYYQHILDVQGTGYQLLCSNCNWIKRYENNEWYRVLK